MDSYQPTTRNFVRSILNSLESQQSLHESETRYRVMFQHMGSGVAVYETRDNGETFVFKDFNRAAENIESVKREELIGELSPTYFRR